MKRTELIFIVAALIAEVLNLYLPLMRGILIAVILSWGALSMLYGYFGFALFNGIRFRQITDKAFLASINPEYLRLGKAIGKAMALMVISLLFTFMDWPGAKIFLYAGIAGMVVMLVRSVFKYREKGGAFYIQFIIRTALWAIVAILVMVKRDEMALFKYRGYPAYVSAYQNAMRNPDNKQLAEQADMERKKIYESVK